MVTLNKKVCIDKMST